MQVVSIISTKGGVGKTTTAANLGGFAADAGLRVLLLDLDVQPTLSSYFTLAERAPAGIYEMLAYNEQRAEQLVSRTAIERLDLVLSNDDCGELNTLLLHAPDGRLRLRHLLPTLRASCGAARCNSSRTSRRTATSASSRRRCTCSSTACIRCRRMRG